ncbi:MAG: cobalamin biosynthesis protein CobD [Synechococcales cyanobacterium RM1_1_8]|nr:cobalamin biosynthesis protein CobD [Synechococcales cyanobacterium RM1_1_8]
MFGSDPATVVITLALASGLDFCLGDPWSWPHPVQFMGGYIQRYQQLLLPRISSAWGQRCLGVGLMLSLVALVVLGSCGLLLWLDQRLPLLSQLTAVVLLASCLAGRSLRLAAEAVLGPLERGELGAARDRLSRYVGRDTAQLSPAEIYRAVFETVTENAVDGVLAPLFYAILGSFTPWGPVPWALGYKALSTLDSMVGYRQMPYTHLGWCSARTEDFATWLPCRLAVLWVALASGQPGRVLRLCWRDARQDPSPNAGWSECAYAAALGVQVGGANVYGGVVRQKPLLGDDVQPVTAERIGRALQLTRWCFLSWLGGAIALQAFVGIAL